MASYLVHISRQVSGRTSSAMHKWDNSMNPMLISSILFIYEWIAFRGPFLELPLRGTQRRQQLSTNTYAHHHHHRHIFKSARDPLWTCGWGRTVRKLFNFALNVGWSAPYTCKFYTSLSVIYMFLESSLYFVSRLYINPYYWSGFRWTCRGLAVWLLASPNSVLSLDRKMKNDARWKLRWCLDWLVGLCGPASRRTPGFQGGDG